MGFFLYKGDVLSAEAQITETGGNEDPSANLSNNTPMQTRFCSQYFLQESNMFIGVKDVHKIGFSEGSGD